MDTVQHLPEGDYVGIVEAAKIAGCDSRTVLRHIQERSIIAYQLQPRVWVVPLREAIRLKNSPSKVGRPRGS